MNLYGIYRCERGGFCEGFQELFGCPPRAEGMGAGRPDTDLENIKNRNTLFLHDDVGQETAIWNDNINQSSRTAVIDTAAVKKNDSEGDFWLILYILLYTSP